MVGILNSGIRPFSNLKRSQKVKIRKELEKKEKGKTKQVNKLK